MLWCLGKDTTGMYNITGGQQYAVKCRAVQVGRGGGVRVTKLRPVNLKILSIFPISISEIIVQSTFLIQFVLH